MDSGNSGSLQSCSGGDDEFDSRCGADDSSPLSALLRQPPPPSSAVQGFGAGGGSLIYGLQELRTPPLTQQSSSSHHWCSTSTAPLPSPPQMLCRDDGLAASAGDHHDQQQQPPAPPPRGSRKRARASRRAPTTVLTTDTSNFRAMVQEFTGIPAPPFAAASASARSRFDHLLFPSRSSGSAAGSPAALPQYLLRPFAHKLHAASSGPYAPPFASPSSAPADAAIAPPASSTATAASPSALLGMQDHHSTSYLSFQGTHGAPQQVDDDGGAKYAAHPAFDRAIAPSSSARRQLQDSAANFFGGSSLPYGIMSSEGTTTTQAHLHHPRSGRGDELSGLLVGGASVAVTTTGGCKATSSSTPPLLERNGRSPSSAGGASTAMATTTPVASATAGMRTQGVDSWVCTSD